MLAALRDRDLGWRADGYTRHTNSLADAADGDAGWSDSIAHTANHVSNAANGDTTCDDDDSGTSEHNSEYRSV